MYLKISVIYIYTLGGTCTSYEIGHDVRKTPSSTYAGLINGWYYSLEDPVQRLDVRIFFI
jgi:hypothetical protein